MLTLALLARRQTCEAVQLNSISLQLISDKEKSGYENRTCNALEVVGSGAPGGWRSAGAHGLNDLRKHHRRADLQASLHAGNTGNLAHQGHQQYYPLAWCRLTYWRSRSWSRQHFQRCSSCSLQRLHEHPELTAVCKFPKDRPCCTALFFQAPRCSSLHKDSPNNSARLVIQNLRSNRMVRSVPCCV